MKNGFLYVLLVLMIIAGIAIGFPVGLHCKKCPEIKVGKETLLVTVVTHDTIDSKKASKDFTVSKKVVPATKAVYDTAKKDTEMVESDSSIDTANCYSFDQKESDGAYIKAEMCSKELPAKKPIDLTGTIQYLAKPDTNRTIARVDTVLRDNNMPVLSDWRTYVMAVLAVLSGILLLKH